MDQEVKEVFKQAKVVLKKCIHHRGLKAAASYYPQVWARDAIISSFGPLLLRGKKFKRAAQTTLTTLSKFQNKMGHIPNYVPCDDPHFKAEDLTNNESVDSNCWYIIGHDYLYQITQDNTLLKEHLKKLKLAMNWLFYRDYNDCGLLEVHECADWADNFPNRDNTLNINVLYHQTLRSMGNIYRVLNHKRKARDYVEKAKHVKKLINTYFWIGRKNSEQRNRLNERFHWKRNYRLNKKAYGNLPYYLPFVVVKGVTSNRFDTMGNLSAILFNVASESQTERILEHIQADNIHQPFPLKACYPPVFRGDPDWRDYFYIRGYSLPYYGHNAGIWPFIGGFYVAALIKAGHPRKAREELEKLAKLNHRFNFPEVVHGKTGKKLIGCQEQAWSAGMFIYAYLAVKKNRCFIFD